MGLGKTIQVLAFLAGLHYSAQHATLNPSGSASSSASSSLRSLGPTLIIVPATIMSQWLREFQEWYPEMRVIVLHDSVPHDARVSKKQLVDRVFQADAQGQGTVLITTYQSIHGNKHLLMPREWGYVILGQTQWQQCVRCGSVDIRSLVSLCCCVQTKVTRSATPMPL